MAPTTGTDKVRENRLRRMAERQGFRLEKNRRRDPRAIHYGLYQLVVPPSTVATAWSDMDSIERFLTGPRCSQ